MPNIIGKVSWLNPGYFGSAAGIFCLWCT